jgi:hypothetical protein
MTSQFGWRRLQTSAALLLVLSLCLYLPALNYGMFADDTIYLPLVGSVLRELPLDRIHELLLKPANPWEYLPLRDLSYWIDLHFYSDEDFGLHASNLIWYGASITALAWMLREVMLLCQPQRSRHVMPIVLCGLVLFALHPVHVEAVVWVSGRKDLMSGTLLFASVASLSHAIRTGWAFRYLAFSALCFLCACFSKAAALSGAIVLSMVILAPWNESAPVARAQKVGVLLIFWGVAAAALSVHLLVGSATGIRIENYPGLYAVIERASMILAVLLRILVIPGGNGLYYDVFQLNEWHWLVCLCSLACVLQAMRVLFVQPAIWALGVLMLFAPMIPYLQFVPFSTWSLASDRFVFVSVAGLVLIVIDVFIRIRRPWVLMTAMLLTSGFLAPLVWLRVADWAYERTLLSREYERQPGFHNAIRDQVVSVLLPAERYADSRKLAAQIDRPYARGVLEALVDAEQAYNEEKTEPRSIASKHRLCAAVSTLRLVLTAASAKVKSEPDISYNNFLRSVQRQLDSRYSDFSARCE